MRTEYLAGAGLLWLTRDISVAFIGVPLNVLVACAIGAFCSFSFSDKVESRGRVWRLFLTCWCMGAAFTALANAALVHWMSMVMTDGLQAGMGAVVSFGTRFFLPWLADVIKHGKWLSWLPFTRSDK